jgi:CDP-glucose 4,6-dehydratase
MNRSFWEGKKVFITGHTGFKGSWLSLWLQSMGANVTGYSLLPPTRPSLFEEANVSQGMTSIIGDIRDLSKLQAAIFEQCPEIIFHLAAQPLVRYSYKNPVETYTTNVMGTVNLLEAIRNTSGIKAVINITTDKCYENREWFWSYRETDYLGGFDPYSNSKACAELVSSAYRSSFFNKKNYSQHGVGISTVRAGNVIGGGDWAQDRLIPDIISAFEQRQTVKIRNPKAFRPWQHVLEPLRGYLILAEHLYEDGINFGEAWNFGPFDEDVKPVSWIVEKMAQLWGNDAKWRIESGDHPHEASILKLDISKVYNKLDWRPILHIEDSLKMVVDWTKQRAKGSNMRVVTEEQINQYENLNINKL